MMVLQKQVGTAAWKETNTRGGFLLRLKKKDTAERKHKEKRKQRESNEKERI
jgi:hypothetical protein